MTTPQTEPELPEPAGYYYEWDGPYGKRKFSVAPHNGRQCDRSVAYYTADQIRAAIAADRAKRVGNEALKWTAATLQAMILSSRDKPFSERDYILINGKSKTVGEILDMANVALEAKS